MTASPNPLINSADLNAELAAIAVGALGWLPLGDHTYLHGVPHGDDETPIITVVGSTLDVDSMGHYLLIL